MIKARELAVGNYFNHNGSWNYANHKGVFKWSDSDWFALGESTLYLEDISPIQLTEEILLNNCGMVKSAYTKTRYDFPNQLDWNNQFHLDILNKRFVFRGLGMSIVYVDTLHDLQSLFFMVKREELEVDL